MVDLTKTRREQMPTIEPFTQVYICDPEWCDEGCHVQEPEPFDAFRFEGDFEEYGNGEGVFLVPLTEGQFTKGYRMPCRTWFDHKPERMTALQAYEENRIRPPWEVVQGSNTPQEDE